MKTTRGKVSCLKSRQVTTGKSGGRNPGQHWQRKCDASTIQTQCDFAGHRISTRTYKGALQTLNRFQELLPVTLAERWPELFEELLRAVGTHRVADRPNRYEPRAVKRRPKCHALLNMPRDLARKCLLHAA